MRRRALTVLGAMAGRKLPEGQAWTRPEFPVTTMHFGPDVEIRVDGVPLDDVKEVRIERTPIPVRFTGTSKGRAQ